jgi:threonine/homoserine/homoserine lactone efflux protein
LHALTYQGEAGTSTVYVKATFTAVTNPTILLVFISIGRSVQLPYSYFTVK